MVGHGRFERHTAALGTDGERPGTVLGRARRLDHGRALRSSRGHVVRGRPRKKVLEAVYASGDPLGVRNYDVFPDGRFLMVKDSTKAKIIVVPDWVEKVKRLVPTR